MWQSRRRRRTGSPEATGWGRAPRGGVLLRGSRPVQRDVCDFLLDLPLQWEVHRCTFLEMCKRGVVTFTLQLPLLSSAVSSRSFHVPMGLEDEMLSTRLSDMAATGHTWPLSP